MEGWRMFCTSPHEGWKSGEKEGVDTGALVFLYINCALRTARDRCWDSASCSGVIFYKRQSIFSYRSLFVRTLPSAYVSSQSGSACRSLRMEGDGELGGAYWVRTSLWHLLEVEGCLARS